MTLKQLAILAALAGAITPAAVFPADAARAVVTRSTNVRAGPGTDFRVVGRLRGGDQVNVTRCSSSRRWCRVQSRYTRNGWVRARNLDRVRGRRGSGRPSDICFFGSRGQVCLSL